MTAPERKTISTPAERWEAGDEPPDKKLTIIERWTKSSYETSSSDIRSLVKEKLKRYERLEEIVSRDFIVLK